MFLFILIFYVLWHSGKQYIPCNSFYYFFFNNDILKFDVVILNVAFIENCLNVGHCLAALNQLGSKSFHIAGHSIGAHLMGKAGRYGH